MRPDPRLRQRWNTSVSHITVGRSVEYDQHFNARPPDQATKVTATVRLQRLTNRRSSRWSAGAVQDSRERPNSRGTHLNELLGGTKYSSSSSYNTTGAASAAKERVEGSGTSAVVRTRRKGANGEEQRSACGRKKLNCSAVRG
jgi:hypothetical protein